MERNRIKVLLKYLFLGYLFRYIQRFEDVGIIVVWEGALVPTNSHLYIIFLKQLTSLIV